MKKKNKLKSLLKNLWYLQWSWYKNLQKGRKKETKEVNLFKLLVLICKVVISLKVMRVEKLVITLKNKVQNKMRIKILNLSVPCKVILLLHKSKGQVNLLSISNQNHYQQVKKKRMKMSLQYLHRKYQRSVQMKKL